MSTSQPAGDPVLDPVTQAVAPAGRVRWGICALLFAAVVLSYVDRLVLPLLKPTLQGLYGWDEQGYATVNIVFQAGYGIAFLFFGPLVDRIGAKAGYLLAMGVWTAAHMGQAFVTSTTGFALARIPLAIGESGTYPAALAATAEWFPKRERALAIGFLNAGANVGAIVTPLIVPVLALWFGWQGAFWGTGLLNLVWIAAWVLLYRRPDRHPRVTKREVAWIRSEPPLEQPRVAWGWLKLLSTRQTWAYMGGRFLIDPVWWMFLGWLPDFFHRRYGIDLKGFGPPLVVVYLIADGGSITGGWASSRMLRAGISTNLARKLAMLGCALIVLPVFFAAYVPQAWMAVALIGLACAGHQGFSSNHFSAPADLFPSWAQGSIVGLGGFAGAMGGILFAYFVGDILQRVGSYTPILAYCSIAYLLALLVVHLLNPRYAPVTKFGA